MTDPEDRTESEPSAPPEPVQPEPVTPGPGVPWGIVVFLVLALLLVIFAVQNTQDVELRFLGWAGEFPLAIVIITVAVVTVLLDEVLGAVLRRRRRKRHAERAELRRLRSRQGE